MLARANQAVLLSPGTSQPVNRKWLRGVFVLLAIMVAFYWLSSVLKNPLTLPIQKIRVQGTFVHVNEAMLQKAVTGIKGTGYFNLDVSHAQQLIEQLPWVKQATIRRVWPDSIAIQIEEQQAMAVWTAGGLLNKQGELFLPQATSYPNGLPIFTAPEGMHAEVIMHYQDVNAMLAPLKLVISSIDMDARHAVSVRLNNGVELNLGRQDVLLRMQRFINVYPQLQAERAKTLMRVDLRYTNGMAVTWK